MRLFRSSTPEFYNQKLSRPFGKYERDSYLVGLLPPITAGKNMGRANRKQFPICGKVKGLGKRAKKAIADNSINFESSSDQKPLPKLVAASRHFSSAFGLEHPRQFEQSHLPELITLCH